MSKILIVIGLALLFHSAYSAAQYRSYLRLLEKEYNGFLPIDILLQASFSLLLTIFAIVQVNGNFKEIKTLDDLKQKNIEYINNRPSFYTFNHRGRIFQ